MGGGHSFNRTMCRSLTIISNSAVLTLGNKILHLDLIHLMVKHVINIDYQMIKSSDDRQDERSISMLTTDPPEKLGRMERSIFLEVRL